MAAQPKPISHAPIFWLLFGGGGMLSALVGVGLVLVTGLALPLGWLPHSALLDHASALGLARSVIGKLGLFAVTSLFAWHAAHRLLCSVHDIGIHKTLGVKLVFYGFAAVVTVVAGWSLLALGF